jgi:hypothetical protein
MIKLKKNPEHKFMTMETEDRYVNIPVTELNFQMDLYKLEK